MADNPQPAKTGWDKWAPTAKVGVGTLAGALSVLIAPVLAAHWKSWTGADSTASVGASVTTVLTFLIQYMVPERT
jgi:hypothetical protein